MDNNQIGILVSTIAFFIIFFLFLKLKDRFEVVSQNSVPFVRDYSSKRFLALFCLLFLVYFGLIFYFVYSILNKDKNDNENDNAM